MEIHTFGNASKSISTIAASRYSRKASAFLDICSASALALADIAKASASPRIRILNLDNLYHLHEENIKKNCCYCTDSASASASKITRLRFASAIFSKRYFSASAGRLTVASSSRSRRINS